MMSHPESRCKILPVRSDLLFWLLQKELASQHDPWWEVLPAGAIVLDVHATADKIFFKLHHPSFPCVLEGAVIPEIDLTQEEKQPETDTPHVVE